MSLVWEENLGSGTFTDNTQVSPSLESSPDKDIFSFLLVRFCVKYEFIVLVKAPLNPARWVPPSLCGILFVNGKTFSLYPSFHQSAVSIWILSLRPDIKIGLLLKVF